MEDRPIDPEHKRRVDAHLESDMQWTTSQIRRWFDRDERDRALNVLYETWVRGTPSCVQAFLNGTEDVRRWTRVVLWRWAHCGTTKFSDERRFVGSLRDGVHEDHWDCDDSSYVQVPEALTCPATFDVDVDRGSSMVMSELGRSGLTEHQEELYLRVLSRVGRLAPHHTQLFRMHYAEGMDPERIARERGVTRAWVYRHLSLIRQQLTRMVKDDPSPELY